MSHRFELAGCRPLPAIDAVHVLELSLQVLLVLGINGLIDILVPNRERPAMVWKARKCREISPARPILPTSMSRAWVGAPRPRDQLTQEDHL